MNNLLTRFLKKSGRRHPRPGDYFSLYYGNKGLKVAKVLVVDAVGVHLRVYTNIYEERPLTIEPSELKLGFALQGAETVAYGGILEALAEGFFPGLSHMPVRYETFREMKPRFIREGMVEDEELEGFREWEHSNGGYW